jgi:hypothetical protein
METSTDSESVKLTLLFGTPLQFGNASADCYGRPCGLLLAEGAQQ